MASRKLSWNVDGESLTVSFDSGEKKEFTFSKIEGWIENSGKGVVHDLFVHGLKQKLADSVAGASKEGIVAKLQIETMEKVWDAICKGNMKTRVAKPTLTKEALGEAFGALGIDTELAAKLQALLGGLIKK